MYIAFLIVSYAAEKIGTSSLALHLAIAFRGGRRYRNVVWQVEEQIALELIIHNRIQTARSAFQITHARSMGNRTHMKLQIFNWSLQKASVVASSGGGPVLLQR